MIENWMPVVGWENFYEVSDNGNVKSIKRKAKTTFGERDYAGNLLKPIKCSNGYMAVNLTNGKIRKQYNIHVLVLEAFVGKRPLNYDACHNDGNKENCKLTNLRWDTRKNNHADKLLHGTSTHNVKKITKEIADNIKSSLETNKYLSKFYGLSTTQIWRIKSGLAWN